MTADPHVGGAHAGTHDHVHPRAHRAHLRDSYARFRTLVSYSASGDRDHLLGAQSDRSHHSVDGVRGRVACLSAWLPSAQEWRLARSIYSRPAWSRSSVSSGCRRRRRPSVLSSRIGSGQKSACASVQPARALAQRRARGLPGTFDGVQASLAKERRPRSRRRVHDLAGALSGALAVEPELSLVYFDAHGDFNTMATTPSHYISAWSSRISAVAR